MSGEREPPIQIRLATSEDASDIAAVLHNSFVEYKSRYTVEGFAATVLTPDQIQVRLNEGPVWIALKNQDILGTVSAVAKGNTLYIRGMAVDPTVRGKGIGHKLLECAEEFALKNGFKLLLLSTTPFLTRAIQLYEKHGFSRSSDGPTDLFGTPLFTMFKPLGVVEAEPKKRRRSKTTYLSIFLALTSMRSDISVVGSATRYLRDSETHLK
jgi:ribosomal protein S18 acetylase RimI-like enzyme